jgi:hypothetical protein
VLAFYTYALVGFLGSNSGRLRRNLPDDSSPLRDCYRTGEDDTLYSLLRDYFREVEQIFWGRASERSYIRKTVGIQALFDVLRYVAQEAEVGAIIDQVRPVLESSAPVDFADPFYQASGKGRVHVKNTILLFSGKISALDLPEQDRDQYLAVRSRYTAV